MGWIEDKIWQTHNNKFKIGGRETILYKEVLPRLLKKRAPFKDLGGTLRRNDTRYRWEYPEGNSLTYKHRIRDEKEVEKFCRKYHKDFGGTDPALEGAVGGQDPEQSEDSVDSQEEEEDKNRKKKKSKKDKTRL